MSYTLVQVEGAKDLSRWLDFTSRLYPNGFFIPPVRQHIFRLFLNKTPYQKSDIEVKFFIVEDERRNVVARTTLHRSRKFDARLSKKIQLFGFTEFVDDFKTFQFLFSELKKLSARNDCAELLGPANLLPNQFGGVVTGGFENRGFVDNIYNHPYYPKFYTDFGLQKTFTSQTFICRNLTDPQLDPDRLFPFDQEKIRRENLQIHCGERTRFQREQLPVLSSMLNESFHRLKYYTPISREELLYQTDGLQFIMENRLFVYLTKNDKPVGFILCIPDLSEFVHSINGNLTAFNLLKLLLARSHDKKEAILIIKGVVPEETGKGYMNLLSRELLKNLRALGYHTLRTTWVELDNKASSAHFMKMNGEVLHDIAFYRMAL